MSNKLVDQFAECLQAQLCGVTRAGRPRRRQQAQKPISGLSLIVAALGLRSNGLLAAATADERKAA